MEIQLWRSILCPYELAVKELMVKFEHIIDEHKQMTVSRLNRSVGVSRVFQVSMEKMQRKHIPMERWKKRLKTLPVSASSDQFEEDIDTVASIIRSRSV